MLEAALLRYRTRDPETLPMMQLYWAPRTRSLRALWMLEEAGVLYERIRLDMATGAHRTPAFKAINPMDQGAGALRRRDLRRRIRRHLRLCRGERASRRPRAATRRSQTRPLPPVAGLRRRAASKAAFMHKFQNLTVSEVSAGYGSFDKTMAVLDEALHERTVDSRRHDSPPPT